MATAAFIGVVCTWLFGLCWLAHAASGLYILVVGRFSRRGRLFIWLDRERRVRFVEGREAIQEGIIRLVGGLFLAAAPLLFAMQATPEVWSVFRAVP